MSERFGKFLLTRQIATGGMAEVWLATVSGEDDGGGARQLALKRIRPAFSSDPDFAAMFTTEASIGLRLQHPNIVRTFELGRAAERLFLSMEFVEGIDLFNLLQQLGEQDRPLPIAAVAYIGRSVAEGLSYAHQLTDESGRPLRLVHRDISPMNVLLSRSGDVKICDFGIAKAADQANRTKSGVIKGKYQYLSPEYAGGEPIDQRTDQFSVGICLWEMLAGRMLYQPEEGESLLDLVREARIPQLAEFRPDIPPSLEAVVTRALQRERDARYPDSAALAGDLATFLAGFDPHFARDQLAEFLHNALAKEVQDGGPSGSAISGLPAGGHASGVSGRRRPDQLTARIELNGGQRDLPSPESSSGSDARTDDGPGACGDRGGDSESEESEMADQPKGPSELGGKTMAMSADEVFAATRDGGQTPGEGAAAPRPAPAAGPKRSVDLRKPAPPRPAGPPPGSKGAQVAAAATEGGAFDQKTAFFNAADPRIAAALEAAKAAGGAKAPAPPARAPGAAPARPAAGAAPAPRRPAPAAGPGGAAPAGPAPAAARPAAPRPAGAPGAAPAAAPRAAAPRPAGAPAAARPAAARPAAAQPAGGDAYSQKTSFFDASDPRIAAALDQAQQAQVKRAATPAPAAAAAAPRAATPQPARPVVRKVEAEPAAPAPAPAAGGAAAAPGVRTLTPRPVVRKLQAEPAASPEVPAATPAQPKVVKAGIKVVKIGGDDAVPAPAPTSAEAPAAAEDEAKLSAKERVARARERKAELAKAEAASEAGDGAPPEGEAKKERPARRGKAATEDEAGGSAEPAEAKEEKKPARAKADKADKDAKPDKAEPAIRVARGNKGGEKKKLLTLPIILSIAGVLLFAGLSAGFVMSMFKVELGKIRVTSDPPGAEITFAGKKLAKKTPYTIDQVKPGEDVEITLTLVDYQDISETVVVTGGDTEQLDLPLVPLPGTLKITSEPDGADVLINGDLKGKTPLTLKDQDRRKSIQVMVQLQGYADNEVVWSWDGAKRSSEMSVTLEKEKTKKGRGR